MMSIKKEIKNNHLCIDDIDCKNKRCSKLHNERKRLNICKFDIFFIPYKDEGCHFEDCTHVHPKRETFYIQKDKDFDNLILSVVNHLQLDDNTPLIEDWRHLMNNINGNDFDKLYQELYSYCITINQLSFQLEALQLYDIKIYIHSLQYILSNVYLNQQKFNELIKIMILRYDEHSDEYTLLLNKIREDVEYISTYKHNVSIMLYQNYGINIIL